MQPPQHLPPDVLPVGKRLRGQDYRVGRAQFDAHEAFIGQQPLAAQPFQRRQHAQQFDMPAEFVLGEGDLQCLALGGEGMEDDRHQVFQGGADGLRVVQGRLGKLLQMAEPVLVQGLEPVAEVEPAPVLAVGQKAQQVRGKPQQQPVGAEFDGFG